MADNTGPQLDAAIDQILAYRPKPKSKNTQRIQEKGMTTKERRLAAKKAVSGKVRITGPLIGSGPERDRS